MQCHQWFCFGDSRSRVFPTICVQRWSVAYVGCCDNSIGKHATKHFQQTQHPLIRSFEPGEDWAWCYVDQLFIEPAPHAS